MQGNLNHLNICGGDNLELCGWLRRLLDYSSDSFFTWMLEGPVRVNGEPDPLLTHVGTPMVTVVMDKSFQLS